MPCCWRDAPLRRPVRKLPDSSRPARLPEMTWRSAFPQIRPGLRRLPAPRMAVCVYPREFSEAGWIHLYRTLAQAMAAVLLGEEPEAVEELVQFSRTTQSYRNLMDGSADILLAAEPADSVLESKEAGGFAWIWNPLP